MWLCLTLSDERFDLLKHGVMLAALDGVFQQTQVFQ